jgi:hypothetical protein
MISTSVTYCESTVLESRFLLTEISYVTPQYFDESFVCRVLFEGGVLFCVMCVICVLCLIVVPIPPGKTPFAAEANKQIC